jgi:hypothetical protein
LKKKVENFENDSKKLAKDLENLAQQKDDLIEGLKNVIGENKLKSAK